MRVTFLQDYTGRETAMKPYKAGDVGDFDIAVCIDLIRNNIAEAVEEDPIEIVPPKQRRKKEAVNEPIQ